MKELTSREREVLQAVFSYDGSIQRAADALCISTSTLRTHLHRNIFSKLMTDSTCGAIRAALSIGIISLEDSIRTNRPAILDANP